MSNSDPLPRISIRCPNCGKDGTARGELMNRRVTCKHCSHLFRALPIVEDSDTRLEDLPPEGQVAMLERENARLREAVLIRRDPAELLALRDQLAQAVEAAQDAKARRREAEQEALGLHDRLDGALEAAREDEARRVAAEAARLAQVREIAELRERVAAGGDEARGLRDELERERAEGRVALERISAEAGELREQVERGKAAVAEAESGQASAIESIRAERDRARASLAEAEGRTPAERESEEVGLLRDRLGAIERLAAGYLARAEAAEGRAAARDRPGAEAESSAISGLSPTLFDREFLSDDADRTIAGLPLADLEEMTIDIDRPRPSPDEAATLRLELAEALAAGERQRAEIEDLRSRPDRPAGDEAAKGAWADFERRLAETQGKLRAANARADLLEAEAREAREQVAAIRREMEAGDFGTEDLGSVTNLRIMADRGTARLTPAEADARLALARRLAVERKDRSLIDRIARMGEKVRADLEARNYTLADTLVRGAEIEAGIDPGGWSLGGLRIYRPGPSITASLAALAPAFDRVMRQGEPAAIRSTIAEMRTILGDQAGLPEIRRPGRVPGVKRPIAEPEAARLFLAAIEPESWLIRPVVAGRPLPETSLATYAALVEAAADARGAVGRHEPDRLDLLDKIIAAVAAHLARRQQPDGHFPFLDPRGKPSEAARVVEAMVAARPGAVKDGWVIGDDPAGMAQAETAACGIALARAGAALNQPEWVAAALRGADWTLAQPALPRFAINARAASQLARAYADGAQPRHLDALLARVTRGLLPGQVEDGRWVDPVAAETHDHLLILRGLHDAWAALPEDHAARDEIEASLRRAATSLLEESARLGVPADGSALRDLIRHRDLFGLDPRLGAAILDSATVVQELCHDGARPRLGVAPDQLAALVRA